VQIVDGQFPGAHFRITMPLQTQGTGSDPTAREPPQTKTAAGAKEQANAA
jgi:hypothetical protein